MIGGKGLPAGRRPDRPAERPTKGVRYNDPQYIRPLTEYLFRMILGLIRRCPALLVFTFLTLGSTVAQADVYDEVERLIRNGQLDKAQQISRQHLNQYPQDPQMRLLGSRIQQAQGKSEEAVTTLESLTQEFPELPEPHNNLAVLYAKQGRPQDALASLNRAIAARPDYTVALENLGDLYLGLALQAYQQARQTPAPSPSAARKAEALPALLSR